MKPSEGYKLKENLSAKVIWQGDAIQCTKSARTRNCKLCMTERKANYASMSDDKHKVINENDDINAACKCSTRYLLHWRRAWRRKKSPLKERRGRIAEVVAVVTSKGESHHKPARTAAPLHHRIHLIDNNVPGLPYRSPFVNPRQVVDVSRQIPVRGKFSLTLHWFLPI